MLWTSIFGVVTLVLLARALGFGRNALLESAEEAAHRAGEAIAGFAPAEAAVAADGRAALVAARDGRLALVSGFGDRFVVRRLEGSLAVVEGDVLRVRLAEPGKPTIALALGDQAGVWAARF
ncbi:hypothetical protein [Polymorphobacter sp.]|uniref:hypothetical protein n=1 Tax=Polymorphobacter sp. TaxID=1909290 RepID=UPI003F6F6A44